MILKGINRGSFIGEVNVGKNQRSVKNSKTGEKPWSLSNDNQSITPCEKIYNT
jgi:DNA topoisomerase VI subunit A